MGRLVVLVGLLDEEGDASVGARDDADGLIIVSFCLENIFVYVNRGR